MWMFFGELEDRAILNGQVILEENIPFGEVRFLSAQDFDYDDYRIVFEQGQTNGEYDETVGIYLVPSLKFEFSGYQVGETLGKPADLANYDFYYYFEFENSGPIFAENGYGMYVSDAEAQSFATRKLLDVDWTKQSTTFSFSPIFHYINDRKPTTTDEYQTMLTKIAEDNTDSVVTLNITFEMRGNS